MVQIYRKKWQRSAFSSLLGYLRDWLVLSLPIKRLPPSLVRRLYGIEARFAFLVHPRTYQDVFVSAPYLKPIKFFLRKQIAYRLVSRTLPFVLNRVKTKQNVNGFVIAQLTLPEIMFDQKKEILERLRLSLRLISKIGCPGTVVGLGGWFPMVTRRGLSLKEEAEKLGLTVTSGHCGTLTSIYMMVEKIAAVTKIKLSEINLALIGVGKMGGNVARAFNQKVRRLILIDLNEKNLHKIREELERHGDRTRIDLNLFDSKDLTLVRNALKESHLGICATSTFRNLLRVKDLPAGFVAIDDSRPEALPRDPKNERIVLEGGLLKIKGVEINYNYGFGQDDNVFGCLGEAFLLALEGQKNLKPTTGDVDMENFLRFLEYCRANGVSEGDLKSSDSFIGDEDLDRAFERRGLLPV